MTLKNLLKFVHAVVKIARRKFLLQKFLQMKQTLCFVRLQAIKI